jgi:predicted DNA-binding transcriptional regulator YafY
MAEKRTDAERRIRQVERFSRLLRVLNCISGSGRWDAEALAKELECSRRTVHRLLQTLSLAGVPWYFDETTRAYRIRAGFRFPLFSKAAISRSEEVADALREAEEALKDAETVVARLQTVCRQLRQ